MYMKNIEKKDSSDIEKIKHMLIAIGLICNSYPSAQHLVSSKDGETVII